MFPVITGNSKPVTVNYIDKLFFSVIEKATQHISPSGWQAAGYQDSQGMVFIVVMGKIFLVYS